MAAICETPLPGAAFGVSALTPQLADALARQVTLVTSIPGIALFYGGLGSSRETHTGSRTCSQCSLW
jgi:hypothetical protein